MWRPGLSWLVFAAVVPMAAAAQDDEAPDLALLEYLGSWDESDEEWLVVAEEFMGSRAQAGEDVPEAFDGLSDGGAGEDADEEADEAGDEADNEDNVAGGESDED